MSCEEQDDIWQTAVYKAISDEYADNNQGFCIEYEMPDIFHRTDELCTNLFPVIYSDARTGVLNKCLEYNEKELDAEYISVIYKYGVLAKSKSMWKAQDEWRLVSCDAMLADDYNCAFYPITRVYLGMNMKNDRRRVIIGICKRKGIPYVGVVRNNEKYQMMECEKLCEECIR